MENNLFSFGLGYLVGLAVLGYVFLLYVIQNLEKNYNFSKFSVQVLSMLHLIAGLSGILFVPSILLYEYIEDEEMGKIIFALALFFVLFIVFFIAKNWDDLLTKPK